MLDLASRFNLLAAGGPAVPGARSPRDAGRRAPPTRPSGYHQAGAAPGAGHVDRGLVSTRVRTPATRRTGRPSSACRRSASTRISGQRLKATEALLDLYGGALDAARAPTLMLRSAITTARRGAARRRRRGSRRSSRGAGFSPDVGIRDVAESWSAIAPSPACSPTWIARAENASSRAHQALALASGSRPRARRGAPRARDPGRLAVVEERWQDALGLPPRRLAEGAAGGPRPPAGSCWPPATFARQARAQAGAQALYARAAALAPRDGVSRRGYQARSRRRSPTTSRTR